MSTAGRKTIVIDGGGTDQNGSQAIPETIREDYVDDLDITWIHRIVMAHFVNQAKKCKDYRNGLNLETKLLQRASTIVEKNMIQRRIKELNECITKFESGGMQQEYINEAKDYIVLYNKLKPKFKKFELDRDNEKTPEELEKIEQRCSIIFSYAEIAKKYFPIDVRRIHKNVTLCSVCDSSLDDTFEDNGIIRCSCGAEIQFYSDSTSQSDATRSEPTRQRNNAQDRPNFEKAFDSYNCRQEDKIPSGLYLAIDQYMTSYGKPVSAEIRQMPLNKDGCSRGNTSMKLLMDILAETGYTDYYDYGRLILVKAWGWVFPDISHLKAKVMEDYDLTQKAFVELENKGRTSAPNRYYRLFRHLQANGHPCTIEDFRIVTTDDILENLNLLWIRMCNKCDYPLILKYR